MSECTVESTWPLICRMPLDQQLTSGELLVMEQLCRAGGQLITKHEIAEKTCLGGGVSNTIEVLVGRIRKKLGAAEVPLRIVTVRARGYMLERLVGEA